MYLYGKQKTDTNSPDNILWQSLYQVEKLDVDGIAELGFSNQLGQLSAVLTTYFP